MGIEITYTLGARGIARFDTVDTRRDTANNYRPVPRATTVIQDHTNTVNLFNGRLVTVNDESLLGAANRGSVGRHEATDFVIATEARVITTASFGTQSRKALITSIRDTWLWSYGIVVDPLMTTGDTIDAFTFENGTVKTLLDQIAAETGEYWRITPDLELQFFAPGTKTTSYNITSSADYVKIIGGVKWGQTLKQFVNRLYLSYGTERVVQKSDVITGDGSTREFPLDYKAIGVMRIQIYDAATGVWHHVATHGEVPALFQWTYRASDNTIVQLAEAPTGTFHSPLGSGVTLEVVYDAQFPQQVIAEDTASIAADGPWEDIQDYPDTFDAALAQIEADKRLARYVAAPKVLTIRTRAGRALPGDVITLNIPERVVSGSWLITAVTMRSMQDQKFEYDLTCVEGTDGSDSWIEQFRRVIGSGRSSFGSAVTSGGSITVSGIGGAGTAGMVPKWATGTTLGDSLIREGTGTPEGVVTAPIASLFLRTDTGDIYRKATGTGNTGWVIIGGGAGTGTVGTLSKWVTTTTLGDSLVTEGSGNVTVGAHLLPLTTDTYDFGRYDRLWNQGYLAQLNAILFALNTQTLFGGYSTIGYNAGSLAAAVSSAATTVNFGTTMTPGHFVLIRAHDTAGNITAEFMQVGTLVSGTTYNVTRNLSGLGAKNWAQGTPFLVRGTTGTGRIDLLAYDGKPRIQFVEQGATYAAESTRALLGNLNGYYGYSTDIFGLAAGDPAAANITVDATNGFRIRHGITNKVLLDPAGNAYFVGDVTATSGSIGGWDITAAAIQKSSGLVGMSSAITAGDDVRFWAGSTTPTSAPFRVTEAGVLVATSANITGAITATSGSFTGSITADSGSVGGWSILTNSLTSSAGTVGLSASVGGGDDVRFWAGHSTPESAPFRVLESGALVATSATVTGTINATGGSISGNLSVTGSLDAAGVVLDSAGLTLETGVDTANRVKWDNGAFIRSYASGGTWMEIGAIDHVSLTGSGGALVWNSSRELYAPGGGAGLGTSSVPWGNAYIDGATVRLGGIGSDVGNNLVMVSGLVKEDSSSVRVKENISTRRQTAAERAALLALNPIQFDFIGGTKNVVGFAAEDVALVAPELVNTDAAGKPTGIRHITLIAHLLELVKDQQTQITALAQRIGPPQ